MSRTLLERLKEQGWITISPKVEEYFILANGQERLLYNPNGDSVVVRYSLNQRVDTSELFNKEGDKRRCSNGE